MNSDSDSYDSDESSASDSDGVVWDCWIAERRLGAMSK